MTLSRRVFLAGTAVLLGFPIVAIGVMPEERFSLPPQARWSKAQSDGRNKVERHFRRRVIPRQYRDQLFEGLVYAVAQGKRKSQEIVDEAGRYLTRVFPEVPNWLKWLATMLSIMASILAILLLFI